MLFWKGDDLLIVTSRKPCLSSLYVPWLISWQKSNLGESCSYSKFSKLSTPHITLHCLTGFVGLSGKGSHRASTLSSEYGEKSTISTNVYISHASVFIFFFRLYIFKIRNSRDLPFCLIPRRWRFQALSDAVTFPIDKKFSRTSTLSFGVQRFIVTEWLNTDVTKTRTGGLIRCTFTVTLSSIQNINLSSP